jgi:hypothetical protein
MARIAAIVPTVKPEVFFSFMDSLSAVERKPDMLFVIDNSADGVAVRNYGADYEVVRPEKPLTVNESWNIGIQLTREYDIVSFLNDDVLLNKDFFRSIDLAFQYENKYCGVFFPVTTGSKKEFTEAENNPISSGPYEQMKRREGWAFSIKREALDACPLIPADILKTFCGDDWIWHYTHKAGFNWYRDLSSVIYHAVGGTVNGSAVRETLKHERSEFKRLIACE